MYMMFLMHWVDGSMSINSSLSVKSLRKMNLSFHDNLYIESRNGLKTDLADSCIFRPAFGSWALQMLVEIYAHHRLVYYLAYSNIQLFSGFNAKSTSKSQNFETKKIIFFRIINNSGWHPSTHVDVQNSAVFITPYLILYYEWSCLAALWQKTE